MASQTSGQQQTEAVVGDVPQQDANEGINCETTTGGDRPAGELPMYPYIAPRTQDYDGAFSQCCVFRANTRESARWCAQCTCQVIEDKAEEEKSSSREKGGETEEVPRKAGTFLLL
jgi:hypothetical protein